MSEGEQRFWVWYDPLLEDHFWLEDSIPTEKFLDMLRKEHVQLHSVQAASPSHALEKIFPSRSAKPRSGLTH